MTEFRCGAFFLTAIQKNVKFNGADLTDSYFYKSDLTTTTFEGSFIAGAWFAESITRATTLIGAYWGSGYIFGRGTNCPIGGFTLNGSCH